MKREWGVSWRLPMSVAIGLAFFLLALCGCHPNVPGLFAEATLPAKSFDEISKRGGFAQEVPQTFPELRLYNRSGQLVYVGHNSVKNQELLEELPGSINRFHVKPSGESFDKLVSSVPQLRDRFGKPDQLAKPSIVSISLEQCHACSVQEEAERINQNRLLQSGYNIVVLQFTKF